MFISAFIILTSNVFENFFVLLQIPNKERRAFGSSRLEVFCKKGVLRNFAKFTGKHLCQSLFFKRL